MTASIISFSPSFFGEKGFSRSSSLSPIDTQRVALLANANMRTSEIIAFQQRVGQYDIHPFKIFCSMHTHQPTLPTTYPLYAVPRHTFWTIFIRMQRINSAHSYAWFIAIASNAMVSCHAATRMAVNTMFHARTSTSDFATCWESPADNCTLRPSSSILSSRSTVLHLLIFILWGASFTSSAYRCIRSTEPFLKTGMAQWSLLSVN